MRTTTAILVTLMFLTVFHVSGQKSDNRKKGRGTTNQGELRLEVVTVPEEISSKFSKLNKQALLYHPATKQEGKLPLVIYLHGSGGANKGIEKMKWKGEIKQFFNPAKKEYATNVLVPQSGKVWDPGSLSKLLDYILKTNSDIDPDRVYCIGFSMGGKGTWEWAMTSPERFAAIIPMAFIPDLSKLKGMVNLPIWAMVGTKDSKPRINGIPKMGKELKKLGSTKVKITIFEGTNHQGTPGKAWQEKGLFDWLFAQSRK